MSETCRFLGRVLATRRHPNLPSFKVHHCERVGSCLPDAQHHERAGGKITACADCRLFEPTGRPSCIHLGNIIRYDVNNLCGAKGQEVGIHACAKHGECSVSRYCQLQKVKTCTLCDEYQSPVDRHHYRSMADLWRDCWAWSNQLPDDIIGFCGVPRSGILVAQALAAHRNVHLIDFSALVSGQRPWETPIRRRLGKPLPTKGTILVVEDTSWSGGTIRNEVKPLLANVKGVDLKYGALYFGDRGRTAVDFGFQRFGHVRQTFQWNIFHDTFSWQQCFDLDGVFCSDCPSQEIDHNETKYLYWLSTIKPLIKPTHAVGTIVTGRLEKYRTQTLAWLNRHGIPFHRLEMYPFAQSNAERNAKHHTVIEWKAETFESQHQSTLFVESDDYQAEQIAKISRKSVVAWPSQKYWNCD
ncbi:MAG: hypothetical protein WCH39_14680 [Schlesneria sp.]